MQKKVIVIGAGITGLSAASYLQMNGYQVDIFESHSISGGLCTGWERKGYTVDGCIHWLIGSSPSDVFYKIWNELIDMKALQFVDSEVFLRIEDVNGEFIDIYTNVNKLQEELIHKAPQDKELILEFTAAIRQFSTFQFPCEKPLELCNFNERVSVGLRVMPYLKSINKWSKRTAKQYALKFTTPLLQSAIKSLYYDDTSFLFHIFTLALLNKKSAGYPLGGSKNFAGLLQNKFIELGGKIHYNSEVSKITRQSFDDQEMVTGIQLKTGSTYSADYVVSAADGYSTIFKMLDGEFVDEAIKARYEGVETCPSLVYVSFGINKLIDFELSQLVLSLEEPLEIDPKTKVENIFFRIFKPDSGLVAEGKTLVSTIIYTSNYQYWVDLRNQNIEKYRAKKVQIGNEVLAFLDKRFGGIKSNLEIMDVSTPASFARYTKNWKGSFAGWTVKHQTMFTEIKKTLPGLNNFYMAGQWVEIAGGLPTCIMSGRNTAQLICNEDKIAFKTTQY